MKRVSIVFESLVPERDVLRQKKNMYPWVCISRQTRHVWSPRCFLNRDNIQCSMMILYLYSARSSREKKDTRIQRYLSRQKQHIAHAAQCLDRERTYHIWRPFWVCIPGREVSRKKEDMNFFMQSFWTKASHRWKAQRFWTEKTDNIGRWIADFEQKQHMPTVWRRFEQKHIVVLCVTF